MNGYDVARAFRADEALKRTFLVALSGYALPEDLQQAAEAGFERHLAKPLGMQALQDLLSSLPEGRELDVEGGSELRGQDGLGTDSTAR
jgi:CheY-like chemotaxis protein